MASIVQNMIGDQAVQLGNEEFVRKLPFGNGWTLLRVGIMYRIFGTCSINAPTLLLGICNGDQQTFTSPSCISYVGMAPGYYAGGSWPDLSYDAANSRYSGTIYTNSTVKRVNGTITYNGIPQSNNTRYQPAATSATPKPFIVSFAKASTSSYSITGMYQSATAWTNTANFRQYEMLRQMQLEGPDGVNTLTGGNATETGLPNVMDTVSVYWSKNVPVIEIYALFVVAYY